MSNMEEAYFNYFDIRIPSDAVADCSHSGRCDEDVEYWHSFVDFSHISDADLELELGECGADWDLSDRRDNELRLLWLAACNIREEQNVCDIEDAARLEEGNG